jgi:phenylacetic acid degradation operon negative regulatory protein
VDPELKPLPARSVVLSLLLGEEPHRMSPAQLVRAGEHFGIPAPTIRVALTRGISAGDLAREGNDYVLGERMLVRMRRQDEAVDDATLPWDGSWEMAVVVVTGRAGPERAALREALTDARLAELREGVWARPANLRRTPAYDDNPVLACFRATPTENAAAMARRLWDLDAWCVGGQALLTQLRDTADPALRLAVAAQIVRHLSTDPLLPLELRPDGWPGAELRTAYAAYREEVRGLPQ